MAEGSSDDAFKREVKSPRDLVRRALLLVAAGSAAWGAGALGCTWLNDTSYLTRDYGGDAGPGAGSDGAVIAVSGTHSCALRGGGSLTCWGDNGAGQLGVDPSATNGSTRPLVVGGLPSGLIGVAVGNGSTCTLAPGGEVWCLGSNGFGALGRASDLDSDPHPVAARVFADEAKGEIFTGATRLQHARYDVCAVTSMGVFCWGYDEDGETGDPSNALAAPKPNLVAGTAGATSVAVGSKHSCAIVEAPARAVCWGKNDNNVLGDGSSVPSSGTAVTAKLELAGNAGAPVQVAAGGDHSCAIDDAGRVLCWGGDAWGQTGHENGGSAPHEIPMLKGSSAIFAGGSVFGTSFTCALKDGAVWCLGANDRGQLGRGAADTMVHEDPQPIAGLSGVTALALGEAHACAVLGTLSTGGRVVCWGANEFGQLGDGTKTDRASPVAVCGASGPCPLQ